MFGNDERRGEEEGGGICGLGNGNGSRQHMISSRRMWQMAAMDHRARGRGRGAEGEETWLGMGTAQQRGGPRDAARMTDDAAKANEGRPGKATITENAFICTRSQRKVVKLIIGWSKSQSELSYNDRLHSTYKVSPHVLSVMKVPIPGP